MCGCVESVETKSHFFNTFHALLSSEYPGNAPAKRKHWLFWQPLPVRHVETQWRIRGDEEHAPHVCNRLQHRIAMWPLTSLCGWLPMCGIVLLEIVYSACNHLMCIKEGELGTGRPWEITTATTTTIIFYFRFCKEWDFFMECCGFANVNKERFPQFMCRDLGHHTNMCSMEYNGGTWCHS